MLLEGKGVVSICTSEIKHLLLKDFILMGANISLLVKKPQEEFK